MAYYVHICKIEYIRLKKSKEKKWIFPCNKICNFETLHDFQNWAKFAHDILWHIFLEIQTTCDL